MFEKMLQFQGKHFIPLRVSDDIYLNHFLFKSYYKLCKHGGFRLYEYGYDYLGHISLEILHYKLNENEAFYIYVFKCPSLVCKSLKILC